MKKSSQNHSLCVKKNVITVLAALSIFLGLQNIPIAEANTWVLNPENGHYYCLTEQMNWFEAEEQAQAWGGHLVTLNSEAEESWIKHNFGYTEHFWIGFSDTDEEGVWVWSSGESVSYTNWDSGEPNNCCDCTPYLWLRGCCNNELASRNWKWNIWGLLERSCSCCRI
jgi:hypothetical protein